jgi:hypothetical protein
MRDVRVIRVKNKGLGDDRERELSCEQERNIWRADHDEMPCFRRFSASPGDTVPDHPADADKKEGDVYSKHDSGE